MIETQTKPLINGNPDGWHMKLIVAQMLDEYKKSFPGGDLDMAEGSVNIGHRCGTIHCAGGWDAVLLCDTSFQINFKEGARQFAQAIGFDSFEEFKKWADRNPKLWGNPDGCLMFSHGSAYLDNGINYEPDSYIGICQHRMRVADRLIQLQSKSEMQ